MSAVVNAIGGTVAKASADWDPIGNFVVTNDVKNANKILQPIESFSNQWDPLAPVAHQVEEWAGEAITNDPVLQWSADTIHDVGTSVDAGISSLGVDPNMVKMAIASTALTLTGQAWAIPLLNAAMVKAQGGSWEDMALSAAASYVAGAAGSYVGDYVSSTVTGGVPITAGQVASQMGISAGSQQAAQIAAQNAAALGFGTTFTASALSNMAAAGVSSATSQLIRTGSLDLDKVLTAATTSGLTTGVSTLTQQIPGFSSLPTAAQKSINTQIASAMQGKNVDMDALGMSLAGDMAMSAMKTYWNEGFAGIEQKYNAAVIS